MTEAEWNEWVNAEPMLRGLHSSFGREKIRLFGCVVYHRVWNYLHGSLHFLLEATEYWATSAISLEQWQEAWNQFSINTHSDEVRNHAETIRRIVTSTYNSVISAVWHAAWSSRQVALSQVPSNLRRQSDKAEKKWQADVLRDLIGNPFRPITINPSWLTSTVHSLANGIYSEKAFDRMPILADALQDAGCDNDDVLNHCRQLGEHCRGCWVIDLLTGRN